MKLTDVNLVYLQVNRIVYCPILTKVNFFNSKIKIIIRSFDHVYTSIISCSTVMRHIILNVPYIYGYNHSCPKRLLDGWGEIAVCIRFTSRPWELKTSSSTKNSLQRRQASHKAEKRTKLHYTLGHKFWV